MRRKDLLEEQFGELSEFPNYAISSYGRVINKLTDREIQPYMSDGFLQVRLTNEERQRSFTLHRLIAMIFMADYDRTRRVSFKTPDRRDCSIFNLYHSDQGVRTSEKDGY